MEFTNGDILIYLIISSQQAFGFAEVFSEQEMQGEGLILS
jgi:hypothetical protein